MTTLQCFKNRKSIKQQNYPYKFIQLYEGEPEPNNFYLKYNKRQPGTILKYKFENFAINVSDDLYEDYKETIIKALQPHLNNPHILNGGKVGKKVLTTPYHSLFKM